ncbi:MAG: hypothetical protein K0R99_3914 [Microbacterium sp.]|jgi:hypothetical protein|uniref:hypothetical protein n=1 Tax=Microbacterium sp. TaxID=51671 RepID=UPI002617E6E7|nr:hypothetical protein [Microbacterium sp.]MDF2562468.1 hypothetical protein [Microbacterium sp.]
MNRTKWGDASVAVLLSGWLIVTALHQMKKFRFITTRIDGYGAFLPLWTFFGPIPGTLDSEVLVRYTTPGGVTDWKHMPMYEPRRWSHLFLHTNRRLEKTMFDAISDITRQLREKEPPENIIGSFAYIVLLSIVVGRDRPNDATHVQFMVVNSSGVHEHDDSLVPAFASAVHPL